MNSWFPIDTAPKDGTRVLLFYRHQVQRRNIPLDDKEPWLEERTQVTSGEFREGSWFYVIGGGFLDEYYTMNGIEPTHWMPIPDPPDEKREPKELHVELRHNHPATIDVIQ